MPKEHDLLSLLPCWVDVTVCVVFAGWLSECAVTARSLETVERAVVLSGLGGFGLLEGYVVSR